MLTPRMKNLCVRSLFGFFSGKCAQIPCFVRDFGVCPFTPRVLGSFFERTQTGGVDSLPLFSAVFTIKLGKKRNFRQKYGSLNGRWPYIYIYMGIVQNQTRASETAEIQRSGSPFRTHFEEKSQFFLGFKVRYVGPVFRTFLLMFEECPLPQIPKDTPSLGWRRS